MTSSPGAVAQFDISPVRVPPRIDTQTIPYSISSAYSFTDSVVVARTPESTFGPNGTDFNGDGDTEDRVAIEHVFDSNSTYVTDIDVLNVAVGDGFTVAARREADSGTDANGDGDLLDRYLTVRDHATGAVSHRGDGLLVEGAAGDLFCSVASASQGQVLDLHSFSTGNIRRFVSADLGVIDENGAVFWQSELFAGDINGDGDQDDRLAVVCTDPSLPLVVSDRQVDEVLAANERWVLCEVWEWLGAGDLNGDGDLADYGVLAMARGSGLTRMIGVIEPAVRIQFILEGDYVFHRNDEGFLGDQNGDGDAADRFLEGIHLNTMQRTIWSFDGAILAVSDDVGLVAIPETELALDVTGDGTMDDWIAHIADATSGSLRSLGYATLPNERGALTGGYAVLHLSERGQGIPLNGDGDAFDNVPLSIHLTTGAVQIVPHRLLSLAPPKTPNGTIGMQLYEDGVTDLNGDQLTNDRAAAVLTLNTGHLTLIQGSGPRDVEAAGNH
ncbi:MAG: hypothetical protein AAGG01_09115, partial [Planctomycetota bacterium]